MFIIKSIRLRNFRAVKEAYLRPLESGITGIFGTNGAGKTTFLIGTMFALFGERPDRTNIASLRRDGSDYDDECSVSVVIEHLDQTVEVLRQIKGKNNKGEVYIYVDGVEVSTTSVGTAETWIRRRLGINAEGFKTAFVVKQKELDSLVSALPSERKSLIEKLAGIEDMNQALIDVRKDENTYKKQLDILPGSLDEHDAAKSKFEDVELENIKINEEFALAKTSLKLSETNFDKVNSAYMSAREKISYIDGLSSRINNKKNELVELSQRLLIAEQRLSGVTEEDVSRATIELDDLDKELVEKREEFNSMSVASSVASKNVIQIQSQIDEIKNITEPEPISISVADLENNLHELENNYNDKKLSSAGLTIESENHSKSIVIFDQHECPTCHRDWDDTEAEKKRAFSAIAELDSTIKILTEDIDTLSKEISETKSLIKRTRSLEKETDLYNQKVTNLPECQSKIKAEKKLITRESVLNKKKESGITLATLRDVKQSELTEAKSALQFKSEVDSLREKVHLLEEGIPKLETELVAEHKTSPDLQNIEQELREAKKSLEEERDVFSTVNDKLNSFNIRYYEIKNNYESQANTWEKKKNIQRKYQEIASQTDILERFRKDSVGRLAPELSSYSTSFISEMTSGAFTEIILSEDFSPSVITASGKERPVSWLSGGEESAVALALRLAISFLITKENPQMLWLDEVLTAQDADRRGSMLGMIRRLPISQVLIINHTQEASDIVDKSITLIADAENGSTIEDN